MGSFLTARQVHDLRLQSPVPCVVDARIPEAYDAAHLSGALNICVFQVDFLDEARRLAPDREAPIIVYGAGPTSFESTDAARRLIEAGYTDVRNFPGGLQEWRSEGFPTVGHGTPKEPARLEGRVPLDLEQTQVEWTGRNLLNKHRGRVRVSSGHLEFRDQWLCGGELVLDMTSITCTDIADPGLNRLLIEHLKSSDFLDTARHPEARLVIQRAAPLAHGRPGAPNLQIIAELTFRGITRELATVAAAGRTTDGKLGAQALVVIDRTEWGSAYGSARFFQELGKHLVNDHVELEVRLVAGP